MRWQPTPGLFGTFFTSIALERRLGVLGGAGTGSQSNKLAGRCQGYHDFSSKIGSIEVYWRADGWWW
jgi:hypothetical protein